MSGYILRRLGQSVVVVIGVIVAVGRVQVANLKALREAAKGANLVLLNVKRGSALILVPIR